MEIDIGSGFFFASARSANFRMLLGVTMSMPVIFLSFSMKRYIPAFMPNSGSSAITTPPVIIGPPSMIENTGTGKSKRFTFLPVRTLPSPAHWTRWVDRIVHRLAQLVVDVFIGDAHGESEPVARL